MKKWGVFAVALACMFAVAIAAQAKKKSSGDEGKEESKAASKSPQQDKTYSNYDYKFELKYPGNWNANENKVGGDKDVNVNVKGVKVTAMKMEIPRMLTVCFTEGNKCESGKLDDDPSANLMVVDMNAAKKMAPKGKAEKADRPEKVEKMEKPECETIERTNVKWAGRSAPWMTIRCPEKKKWRYTTTVMMQRPNGKAQDAYTLMCSMRSKSKDKEESFTEYKDDLKPRCQKMVSTTKFRK
ncbi:MAG: hypothetical protein WC956_09620 [bacterium]